MATEDLDLRYEVKSVLPATELARVHSWLRAHSAGFRVAYPPRAVNSLYFDSPDRLCFRENLSGIARRRKLRLRWYGDSEDRIDAVLEMKCKEGLLGWKESVRIEQPLSLAGTRWSAFRHELRSRIPQRFRLLLDLAGAPVLLVRYHRAYLVSADGLVRVTVDVDVESVDQTRHAGARFGPRRMDEDLIVLEVKGREVDRPAVEHVLAGWPLRVSRNSKFARGMATHEIV